MTSQRVIRTYLIIAGLYSLAAVPVLITLRRLGGSADIVVGEAGTSGPCAAHGLPYVAAVDSLSREGSCWRRSWVHPRENLER